MHVRIRTTIIGGSTQSKTRTIFLWHGHNIAPPLLVLVLVVVTVNILVYYVPPWRSAYSSEKKGQRKARRGQRTNLKFTWKAHAASKWPKCLYLLKLTATVLRSQKPIEPPSRRPWTKSKGDITSFLQLARVPRTSTIKINMVLWLAVSPILVHYNAYKSFVLTLSVVPTANQMWGKKYGTETEKKKS